MRRDLETAPGGSEEIDSENATEREKWVRCVACGARVARDAARIAVNGAHVHDFMNPSGIRFRVACFSEASGCVPRGERSSVWTWFPGFDWQIEVCRACSAHLGWSFHGGTTFYGLAETSIA